MASSRASRNHFILTADDQGWIRLSVTFDICGEQLFGQQVWGHYPVIIHWDCITEYGADSTECPNCGTVATP